MSVSLFNTLRNLENNQCQSDSLFVFVSNIFMYDMNNKEIYLWRTYSESTNLFNYLGELWKIQMIRSSITMKSACLKRVLEFRFVCLFFNCHAPKPRNSIMWSSLGTSLINILPFSRVCTNSDYDSFMTLVQHYPIR